MFLPLLSLFLPIILSVSAEDTLQQAGQISTHLFPECGGSSRGRKPTTLPPDTCLRTSALSLRILTPATCANGTRAQYARFPGPKCNYGEISTPDGLLDIRDSDIGACLDSDPEYGSMSFWCDGFGEVSRPDPDAPEEDEKPKPKKGSYSESACQAGKAPFFKHPQTDTCMDLKTQRVKLYSTGVCADGTAARWARYKGKGCAGEPSEIVDVEEDMLETCLSVDGTGSFAFWCTGEGVSKGKGKGKAPAAKGGMPVFLIVLFTIMGAVFAAVVGFLGYANRDKIMALVRRDGYSQIALE